MSNEREKVKCKTALEFITEVADDCVANLKDKDREHLIRNPYVIDYHFSYCLYIRNHYIHNKDFSDVDFWTEPDDLSSEIIRMIFAKLIPEYDYDNQFIENLFDDERFIQLRQEYRAIYGDYPVAMVEEYKEGISFEPALFMSEISSSNHVDIDKEMEVSNKNYEKSCAHIEKLLKKLAEKVWRLDQLRQTAEECGIDYEELIPKIQEIQRILFEDREYIPVEVCLLPYKKSIGQKRYIEYRRRLSKLLEEHPRLMKKKKPHMMIALCGCMMQEAHVVEKLKKSYRFVDLIFGTHNIFKFPELLCYAMESDRMIINVWKDTDQIVEDLPVDRKYKFKSGVNIMFGCNNFCSYCIVPYVRGRERSRNPGETEEDFLETMDVVGKVGYDSAVTFIYSKRSGTPAAAKENQVPEEVVKDRFDRLFQTDSSGRMQGILLYGNTCRIENVTVHSDFCLNIIE